MFNRSVFGLGGLDGFMKKFGLVMGVLFCMYILFFRLRVRIFESMSLLVFVRLGFLIMILWSLSVMRILVVLLFMERILKVR